LSFVKTLRKSVNHSKGKGPVANGVEALPNYQSHPESPAVKDLGVQIKLAKASFRPGEPVVLRGAYRIDQKFARRAEGAPLTQVMLIVVRRDELGIWHGIVQEGHNIMPEPPEPGQRDDPTYREGGYFNLELTSVCRMIVKPGFYWILASMGDAVSDRTEFEVQSK